jgi:SAM-dependent methyltransferase
MEIATDGMTVRYKDYDEYLAHQAQRRNVVQEDAPIVFNPDDHPWIVHNLKLFYRFVRPDSRILDVGCRSGWSCLRMLRDGYTGVAGIDVQADNVAFAQRWSAPVQEGDAHHLGFADETFDAVFTRHSLEHMFDPAQVIRECWRVLKRGGVFFAVVPIDKSITDLEHAHTVAFDGPARLLPLCRQFTRVYFGIADNEMVYVGAKPGAWLATAAARLRGAMAPR